MKYAIIKDNKVVNIAVADAPIAENWIEAGQSQIGWSYDGTTLTPPPAEELADMQAKEVRQVRNLLLSESDWTQVPDSPVDSTAWATYRQALRDITAHANFPYLTEADWPTKPE